jgi:hypothetical protein
MTPRTAPPRADLRRREAFNFAQHLIDCNATRPAKAAFVDDQGTLTYGELATACAAWRLACWRWASSAKSACCC